MQGELSVAVAGLSAMLTPAVLISACGSLLVATSQPAGAGGGPHARGVGCFPEMA